MTRDEGTYNTKYNTHAHNLKSIYYTWCKQTDQIYENSIKKYNDVLFIVSIYNLTRPYVLYESHA